VKRNKLRFNHLFFPFPVIYNKIDQKVFFLFLGGSVVSLLYNKWFSAIPQTIIPNLNGSQRDIPVNGFLTLPMSCFLFKDKTKISYEKRQADKWERCFDFDMKFPKWNKKNILVLNSASFLRPGVQGCLETPGLEPQTLRFPAWCNGNPPQQLTELQSYVKLWWNIFYNMTQKK